MPVFISHAFTNKAQFDNIGDALAQSKIDFWDPIEIKPGSSLSDQLRRAVDDCSVCVFVATRDALGSSWCGSELGAFWGAGKPIIVFLAESSLTEKDLPPIVQGDVWEPRISRVVARAKELLEEARANAPDKSSRASPSVGNMTKDQLERIITGAISLSMAAAKDNAGSDITQAAKSAALSVAGAFQEVQQTVDAAHTDVRKQILWVDDRPANNVHERQAFEALGITFTLARSTNEALGLLSARRFGAIISDMGRKEGPREGYVLLDALRARGDRTPFIIYAASNSEQHKREAQAHGAQGATNNAQELFDLVRQVLR